MPGSTGGDAAFDFNMFFFHGLINQSRSVIKHDILSSANRMSSNEKAESGSPEPRPEILQLLD